MSNYQTYRVTNKNLRLNPSHSDSIVRTHQNLFDCTFHHLATMKYCSHFIIFVMDSDHFVYAPSQWETTLHCNVVSHWLDTYTKWSLEDKDLFTLQSEHRGCWWGGYSKSQGISSHDIDLIAPEYSGYNACWVNILRHGTHFTNNFSIVIHIWWKFHFALIQAVAHWLLLNFAHGMTAVLSWQMQNFVGIWYPTMELHSTQFSIIFELWWKNCSWNGPQTENW